MTPPGYSLGAVKDILRIENRSIHILRESGILPAVRVKINGGVGWLFSRPEVDGVGAICEKLRKPGGRLTAAELIKTARGLEAIRSTVKKGASASDEPDDGEQLSLFEERE